MINFLIGIASFYTVNGCVGCNADRIMANGEQLNDYAYTVAYNRAPLGSHIIVVNPKNSRGVVAEVTDRGGFEKLGRIIDLSYAVKHEIQCSDLCQVIIFEL